MWKQHEKNLPMKDIIIIIIISSSSSRLLLGSYKQLLCINRIKNLFPGKISTKSKPRNACKKSLLLIYFCSLLSKVWKVREWKDVTSRISLLLRLSALVKSPWSLRLLQKPHRMLAAFIKTLLLLLIKQEWFSLETMLCRCLLFNLFWSAFS